MLKNSRNNHVLVLTLIKGLLSTTIKVGKEYLVTGVDIARYFYKFCFRCVMNSTLDIRFLDVRYKKHITS